MALQDIININGTSPCKKSQEVIINYGVGGQANQLQIQFSIDGLNWHNIFQEGDLYQRQRVGNGTWTVIPLYPPTEAPESSDTGFIQV